MDPITQPRLTVADITYAGKFSIPSYAELDYSVTGPLAVSNGQFWYAGEGGARPMKLARLQLPALGATATVLTPSTPLVNIEAVNPRDPNRKIIGGAVLLPNGRLAVSAYSYYDADGTATHSHFTMDPITLKNQQGPFRIGSPGFTAGYMGSVPPEWRTLLGGDTLTGQGMIAIITRTSLGPSATIFNAADLETIDPVPNQMLIGYPYTHPTLGTWEGVGPYFTGADTLGGIAFPSGTRTVLFVGRHGYRTGSGCYGYGTNDPALDGTVAADGSGNHYCYDPSTGNKGPHSYPYKVMVWAYDATDMVKVKQGILNPWDVIPYATWELPGPLVGNLGVYISGATYDDALKKLYVFANDMQVYVFDIKTPPAPVNCQGTWSQQVTVGACDPATGLAVETTTNTFTVTVPPSNGGAACPFSPVVTTRQVPCVVDCKGTTVTVCGEWGPCVDGRQFRTCVDEFTVTTSPKNGGKPCPPAVVSRTEAQPCVNPPTVVECEVRGIQSPYSDKDAKLTVRCNTNGTVSIPLGFKFTITIP